MMQGMTINTGSAVVRTLLAAFLPAMLCLPCNEALAWGASGHRIISRLAIENLPADIPAFLRTPEAKIHPLWADALGRAAPEDTLVTRAFSGRAGRGLATGYVRAAAAADAPAPAPYPVQRGLTQGMRDAAVKAGDLDRMQAWAGQSAGLAMARPAADVTRDIWEGAVELLR